MVENVSSPGWNLNLANVLVSRQLLEAVALDDLQIRRPQKAGAEERE